MTDNIYLTALKGAAANLELLDSQAAELREKRANLMWEARRLGASYAQIAEACGVTKAYVHQIVTKIMKEFTDES